MVVPITYGRLGNFLFQIASAIAYSLEHGLEYTVPTVTTDSKWSPIYLQHLASPLFNSTLPSVKVEEKDQFPFHQREFKEEWRSGNVMLDGYWQSEKYFKHCRVEVEKAFKFPYYQTPGRVAVHVRRGDYLKLKKKHPHVSAQWIHRAMALFPGRTFRFFSDDIAWCKQTFGHRADCDFQEGRGELADLVSMSWCEHQICSASTFSWWGAWLNRNPDKRVIMPTPWFVPGWKNIDTRDIVPVEWERFE